MNADEEFVKATATLLAKSLDYREAKEAEAQLRSLEAQPGFALVLLQVVSNTSIPSDVCLAGALFFKNLIKRRWTDVDGNYLLPLDEVSLIKQNIVSLMVEIPQQPAKQLGEATAFIANSDFPERWENLVPMLISKLDISKPEQSNAVLDVTHAIFERWRPLERSDALFLEIQMVLDQFTQPYLAFMEQVDLRINETQQKQWYESMNLLIQIFYDFNCQDLPVFFEDHIQEFMGYLLKYLSFTLPPGASADDDDDVASVYESVRTSVCEALTLYTERYEEEFAPFMSKFVEAGWTLLTTTGPEQKHDLLVNRCLAFLTAVAKFERNLHLFSNEETMIQITERIVIPNMRMRESDLETFEDEPLDYIRQDLEGSDNNTRRYASQVFLRELAGKMENEVTQIVMRYVDQFNTNYSSNPSHWLDKSTASALFTAIAAKGQITAAGVTSTNPLLNVVQYFQVQMAPELANSTSQAVLKSDAIRFLLSFRNQLDKSQLTQVIPVLTQLLDKSQHGAVYTYAAISLERILAMRDPTTKRAMFGEEDLAGHVRAMSTQTLKLIASGTTKPEELASNEFLIRFLMRILVTSGSEVKHVAGILVPQLAQILSAVSSNPSNPRFNHYLFECLGACLKYHKNYETVEVEVVQPLFAILGADVTEFVPYILQLLTEILALQPTESGLPASYQQLLKPVLSPQLWEARGNVPALVGLLEVIVKRGPSLVIEMGLLMPLLGVFQNLLASSARDQYTFELLFCILSSIPLDSLSPNIGQIGKLLLARLEKGKSDRYNSNLTRFIYNLASAPTPLGAQFAINLFDQADPVNKPEAFGRIFGNIILPKTLQIHGAVNRKVAAVGLTNLLCGTTQFVSGSYTSHWQSGISQLVGLLTQSIAEEATEVQLEFDVNELVFGSSYSPLSTTKMTPPDPLTYLGTTPDRYFTSVFQKVAQNSQIQQQLNGVSEEVKQYLIAAMNA